MPHARWRCGAKWFTSRISMKRLAIVACIFFLVMFLYTKFHSFQSMDKEGIYSIIIRMLTYASYFFLPAPFLFAHIINIKIAFKSKFEIRIIKTTFYCVMFLAVYYTMLIGYRNDVANQALKSTYANYFCILYAICVYYSDCLKCRKKKY